MQFVLPKTSTRPFTLNIGMRMPAVLYLASLDAYAPDDATGIDAPVTRVRAVSHALMAQGFPADRVALAGF